MTQDEIIAMAREAGFIESNAHSDIIVRHSNGSWVSVHDILERFHALAVAAEREACAELMERQHAWITNTAAANAIRARSTA
jgi:phosphatidylserine decarboxylase